MTESAYMKRLQVAAAKRGVCLYRNNVGMCRADDGRFIRFGLAPGSADLIGWTPVVITPEHVGKTLAVFTSIETKSRRGRVRDEQRAWMDAVIRDGGIARIMREPEEL